MMQKGAPGDMKSASSSTFSHEPHFRYLPVLDSQKTWGLYLTDCGYTVVEPGTTYPPQRHPETYQFDWKSGRTLNEYQIVYITRGRGIFESRGSRLQSVEAGDLFLLFPGVWHRYTPDAKSGWDEQWLGFNGPLAGRFLNKPFFSAKKPVLRIGLDESLRQRFIDLVNDIIRDPAGTPFSSTGDLIKILGIVLERIQSVGAKGRMSNVIREAQNHILRQASSSIDFESMAQQLGIGYSSFRHRFKQQTGVSPIQFQSSIRLNRAKDLLVSTDLSVSEIATICGFENIYYFSRHFTEKLGIPPTAYRTKTR